MSFSQEFISGGTGVSKEFIAKISGGVLLAGTAFKAVAKVEQGEMGVRKRFGRTHRIRGRKAGELYGIVLPGYHPIVPFTHSIKTVSVQDRSNDLSELSIDRPEQYTVKSSILWRVSPEGDNPYRALFNVREGDLDQAVTNMCVAGLRDIMTDIKKEKMRSSHEVTGGVNELCREGLADWGVELKRVNIHSVARSIGEMLRPTPEEKQNTLDSPETDMGSIAVALGNASSLPELRAVT